MLTLFFTSSTSETLLGLPGKPISFAEEYSRGNQFIHSYLYGIVSKTNSQLYRDKKEVLGTINTKMPGCRFHI